MNNTSDHIDELLAKYIANEANEPEIVEIKAWMSESADNKSYFENFKTIAEEVSKLKDIQTYDEDAAWNKVKEKLEGKTIPFVPARQFSFLRIAAAISFLVVAGVAIFLWLSRPVDAVEIASEEVKVDQSLPDGSVAFLNKSSTISYSYNQLKKERKIKLSGEAYFDVKHVEEKPFIIETNDVIIEDIGTTFNVKAYPDSTTVEVYVETGEVAFYTKENPGIKLVQGQTGIYNRTTKTFAKFLEPDTNRLAYKTGVFAFHDTDLESVVRSLNEVFDRKIRLKNDDLKTCRLNVSFRNESIENILEILAETLALTITTTENEIVLDGKGCSE